MMWPRLVFTWTSVMPNGTKYYLECSISTVTPTQCTHTLTIWPLCAVILITVTPTHKVTHMHSDHYVQWPHTQSYPYVQWSLCTVTPHRPLCTVTPMYSEPYVQWSICTVTPKQWTLCAVIHMYSNPPHIYSEPDVQWSIFTVTSIHTLTPMYSDQYIEWPNTHSDPYLCSAHYVQ